MEKCNNYALLQGQATLMNSRILKQTVKFIFYRGNKRTFSLQNSEVIVTTQSDCLVVVFQVTQVGHFSPQQGDGLLKGRDRP